MRIAVFGATGRTGREVVTQALAAGHTVTAFVRNRDKLAAQQDLSNERLTAVTGDVRDYDAVARAVEGADAVVSCLAPVPKEGLVQTEGTRNIVRAMEAHGVRRIVSETGAGVEAPGDPERSLGGKLMRGVMQLVAGKILADGEGHAEVLRASDLDYAVVRPPRLTDAPHSGRYRHGILALGPGASVARADVADFMLAEATGGEYHRAEPHVTGA
ncbi:MAG: NAD(P)H-binding protein [Rhodothermales bacterium]